MRSPVSVKAVRSMAVRKKKVSFSLEWKRVGVMDNDSGDNGTDELRQFS